MPSFTTVFRTSVMLIAAIIAVEAWQLYGPSTTWLKSVAARALELAHESLNSPQQAGAENSGLVVNASENAPAYVAPPPSLATTGPAIAAPPVFALGDLEAAPPVFPQPTAPEKPAAGPSDGTPASSATDADRMPALMNRLEELGVVDPQLAQWGSSGQLYRFCCRVALGNATNSTRHFESVAAEPLVAVEEVVAEVEAWRTAEQGGNQLQ